MWPHTHSIFCIATIFSHIMFVPILLVLIFCRRTLAMYFISGRRESEREREMFWGMFEYSIFTIDIFYWANVPFVGTLYLNLISCMYVCVCVFFFLLSLYGWRVDEEKNDIAEMVEPWCCVCVPGLEVWGIWKIPYDHDVNIMKSREKSFHLIFFRSHSPILSLSICQWCWCVCVLFLVFHLVFLCIVVGCHLWIAIDITNVRQPEAAFRYL